MAEKLITSRVKQRFDTLTEWQKVWETLTPLKGEVCKVQIPVNTAVTGLGTSSSVRVMTKTGDGETPLKDLPWDSAIGADETQLSKGTDVTASATLTHGGTFTAVTDTTVNGHKITDKTTTYTLPAETVISVDQTKASTQKTPAHGGTFDVVTSVVKGDSSHNVDVTTTTVKLPSETGVTVDTLTAQTGTLTHGGNFTALTAAVKGGTSHNIDVTPTKFTLPTETSLSVDQLSADDATAAHGGAIEVVTGVVQGGSSHNLDVTKTKITLPTETALSRGTDSTGTPATLSHGGKFKAVTDTTVSGHTITDTVTEFTLPAETTLSKGTDATVTNTTLTHGGTFTVITDTTVSGHTITDVPTKFTLPSETTLSKGEDSNTAATLTHGGTFTAVVDTTVSGHKITDVTKTFTMPAETALSVDQGDATSTNLSHGGTVTVLTGVTKGNTSHNIDVAKTTIKLPSETTLSKGEDVAGTAKTLSHGGTFSAVTDTTVDGHEITETVTEFTLPAETTLTKGTAAATATTPTSLSHGGTFTVMTDTEVSGHQITDKNTTFKLPTETAITVDTLSANTKTLTHGESFTALTAAVKGGSSHNIDVTPTTFTLPALPTGAMIFKGTLGTGGTVTALPTSPVAGWSYKVITAGTYANISCTVGDMLVHDGSAWVLIPSGDDEQKGTVTSVATGQGLSGGTITTSGTIKHVDVTRTDTTSTATGSHGGTVTVVDGITTDTMGHVTAANIKTVTLPSETSVGVTATTGSQLTPAHAGTVDVVTKVEKGSGSHEVKVTTQKIKLPSETSVKKGTDATAAVTLTHGGTFVATTGSTASGHTITDTKTTFTMPAETAVTVDGTTATTATSVSHGGTVNVVTGVTKGGTSHNIDVAITPIKLPTETKLSKGTDATAAATLTHGGTFTAITETAVDNHKITETTTTYTLPAETTLTKGTDATAAKTLEFGKTFTAVTDTSVSGHKITDTTTTFTMPSETAVSVDTLTAGTSTLTHGGTFTALTAAAKGGSSHNIDVTPTTFTMPAETALTVDQGTASSSKPAHGGTVTVISGVTKGDSSHNLDIAKTTITFPSETTLSKGTDATAETQTLAHGGTFTAITDIGVSGHTITDKPTTFTLPSETTLSVNDSESGNAVTDVTVSGHTITLKRGKNFLTAHPTVSVGTDSTSTQTATHGGTFTAVDSITRDGNGHVTKINTKTVTLPADNDTKNTAGGGNTSSKIYIVGTLKQETGTSYTHDTAYVGTDGCLYSGGSKVLTSYTDTKNTAGSTNTSSKIYLVGATSQAANPQTYSHDTAYVGTDGHLYSNSAKVLSTTYAPEAYLQWGGKDFAGACSPLDAALIEDLSANRLAGLPADKVKFERSSNAGSSWSTYTGNADLTTKAGSASNANTTSSKSVNNWHRITFDVDGKIYCDLVKIAINLSTEGATGCKCKVEYGDYSATTVWATAKTADVAGWSGWNIIQVNQTIGSSTYGKVRYVRLTFSQTGVDATYSSNLHVYGVRFFSSSCWNAPSALAQNGHVYTYDASQNVTFPADLNTTGQLKENGTRVSKVGHTHSVTAAGTISTPTFTGTAASHNHTFTGTEAGHTHTFTGTAASHDHSFTGTKHKHTFTGTAVTSGGASATTSVYSITGVGSLPSHPYTAPSLTASCTNQCLTLTWSAGAHSFSAGSLPTRSDAITVATAHTHSVTASGTLDEIAATGTVGSKSVTPAGTIAETKITPAGTVANKSITPAGTISQPTFTGTAVTSGGSSN